LESAPEYLVEFQGARCLCEVKQFAATTNSLPGDGPTWDGKARHKPIRTQVHHGARKLRNARALGLPLIVVLTNPHRAPVLLDDADDIVPALHGDLVINLSPGGDAAMRTGLNGELTEHHSYLTGVVVLHEHLLPKDGLSFYASSFLPGSPTAVALPDRLFRGPYDRVYEYSGEQGRYIQLHPTT
jgi:hypothetical protein